MVKYATHENSKVFLTSVFLCCPDCDSFSEIQGIERDHFTVVCPDEDCTTTGWKVEFKITEV